jgi:four helix bundle protein
MKIYSFEKLEVWMLSKKFVLRIYKLTGGFPDCERYGLVNQLRRAAISISTNLAEGSGRNTTQYLNSYTPKLLNF